MACTVYEVEKEVFTGLDFNYNTVSITKQFSDKVVDFTPPKNDASVREIKIPQYVMKYLKNINQTYLPIVSSYSLIKGVIKMEVLSLR